MLIGIGPLVGLGLLTWLLVLSVRDMSDPENSYSGQSWFGVGPPLVIGIAHLRRGRGADVHLAHPGQALLGGEAGAARPRRGARGQGRRDPTPTDWKADRWPWCWGTTSHRARTPPSRRRSRSRSKLRRGAHAGLRRRSPRRDGRGVQGTSRRADGDGPHGDRARPRDAPRRQASPREWSSWTRSPPRRWSRSATRCDATVIVVGTAGESPIRGAMLGLDVAQAAAPGQPAGALRPMSGADRQ